MKTQRTTALFGFALSTVAALWSGGALAASAAVVSACIDPGRFDVCFSDTDPGISISNAGPADVAIAANATDRARASLGHLGIQLNGGRPHEIGLARTFDIVAGSGASYISMPIVMTGLGLQTTDAPDTFFHGALDIRTNQFLGGLALVNDFNFDQTMNVFNFYNHNADNVLRSSTALSSSDVVFVDTMGTSPAGALFAYDVEFPIVQGLQFTLSVALQADLTFAGLGSNASLDWGNSLYLGPMTALDANHQPISVPLIGSSGFDYVAGPSGFPSPAPETETYAMMLAGLGMLGFVGRRSKRQAA